MLLLLAAGWELAASRPGGLDSLVDRLTGRGLGDAALQLGIPDRLTRAGLGARVPVATILLAKLGATAAGAIAGLARRARGPRPPLDPGRDRPSRGRLPRPRRDPRAAGAPAPAQPARLVARRTRPARGRLDVGAERRRGIRRDRPLGRRPTGRRAADGEQRAGLRRAALDRPRRPARAGAGQRAGDALRLDRTLAAVGRSAGRSAQPPGHGAAARPAATTSRRPRPAPPRRSSWSSRWSSSPRSC